MTTELYTPSPAYEVQGIGPYAVPHPYVAGSLTVAVILEGERIALSDADFTATPASTEGAGDITLTPARAAELDGGTLHVRRVTPVQQGWVGLLGERERGLEVQLDRMTMAVQELQDQMRGTLRVDGDLDPFVMQAGRLVIADDEGNPAPGPDATDISAAQANAAAALAAAEAAAASAAAIGLPPFDDVATLLDDEQLSYAPGAYGVAPGDFVRTRDEGFAFMVAEADAVDHHAATVGGVKLYVRPFRNAFATRAAFIAAIAAGHVWADGTVVTAGGHAYLRVPGSTDIADLPGWSWYGPETFWHHGGNHGDPDLPTRVTIRHVRSGGQVYDVIEIRNPSPQTLRKEFAPGVAVDGVVDRITPREFARTMGYAAVLNCDAWRNSDGTPGYSNVSARPTGLQIAGGVLYQDWLEAETRDQAIVMTAQGRLVRADKAGPTGAEWVAQNARWSAHFGVCVVEGGVAQNVDASYLTAILSARNVLGQRANGDLVIIMIEGISGSYGASGTQAGVIAAAEGCEIAYVLDGGGSAQAWWRDCYAVPSSDDAFESERAVPSFLVIEAPVPDYDTGMISVPAAGGVTAQIAGWPVLALRQRGAKIDLHVNATASFITTNVTNISSSFPDRFRPADAGNGLAKGALCGPGGILGSAILGTVIQGRASTAAASYLLGTVSWPAMHSGLPVQNQ